MERDIKQITGERITVLRRRKGWTQPELAKRAKMGATTLNRIENGHQATSTEKLAALARILGTSTDYLLGLSENADSEQVPAAEALVPA
jgi:transcriptional regulator with XRE-family HTH domain